MSIKIRNKLLFSTISILILSLFGLPARAALFNIDFTSPATNIFGTAVGPGIEDGLNTNFFNPVGVDMDMAAAYVAISSGINGNVSISDKGLVVISNSGFILRFDDAITVTSVQMTFNDFFDDGTRNLYAYDFLIDYTRDSGMNWSPKGSVTVNPLASAAINSDTGSIPYGNSGNTLTLSVSGSNIRSVWANTPPLFSGVSSISIGMNTQSVPEPSSLALLGLGLASFCVKKKSGRVRRAHQTR